MVLPGLPEDAVEVIGKTLNSGGYKPSCDVVPALFMGVKIRQVSLSQACCRLAGCVERAML